MIRRAVVLTLTCLLAAAGCATTAESDRVVREGYLSSGPSPKLYETAALRDAGLSQACVQILRPEAAQTAVLPTGRVRVTGKAGEFDGVDLVRLQVGDDIATDHRCDARYILWADITPIPGT